jgi:hypothetical protein
MRQFWNEILLKSPLTYKLREYSEPIARRLFNSFKISWQAVLSIAAMGYADPQKSTGSSERERRPIRSRR